MIRQLLERLARNFSPHPRRLLLYFEDRDLTY